MKENENVKVTRCKTEIRSDTLAKGERKNTRGKREKVMYRKNNLAKRND